MINEVINLNVLWSYFDGATHGEPRVCGIEDLLNLSENHWFRFQVGLGHGSNNFIDLSDLRLLLCLAMEKGLDGIHIFGDTQIIVNWINGKNIIHNLLLESLLHETLRLKYFLDSISIKHVYREIN